MDFTEEQVELIVNAWALGRIGCGQVIQNDFYPAAHALAEAGWLEHRFEPDGEMSWWWTPQAETALDINDLVDVSDRQN
jgi:hypothetical protein